MLTEEQYKALARQADAQRVAAARALELAKQKGLTGKAKLEFIARAIEDVAQKSANQK